MKAIELKDYRPLPFVIQSIDLVFELFEDKAWVTARSRFVRNEGTSKTVFLNGKDLSLLQFECVGHPNLQHRPVEGGLEFEAPAENFECVVKTEIAPQNNKTCFGLYRSRSLFTTQMESEGFRRVTYYLDRPDNSAVFRCRIEADQKKYPVLLSNGNRVGAGALEQGRHYVEWSDPWPKPCYLFALVAGDLEVHRDQFTTQSGRSVNLEIYTQKQYANRTGFAMESLKKAMRWDEQAFGREYDLDNFMIVAVDDFNFGAMENKGLNIFNGSLLLANPETAEDHDFQAIESVVAHEYFHNWSGNRVTVRDWFQISLKEGFTVFRDQEFSSDMNSRGVQRISDVRALRSFQFAEDNGPHSHPVQPKSYIAVENFYTATVYNKGAELIRMMKTLVGPESFRQGCDLYFSRYDGKAATIESFAECQEESSGVDLAQFKGWYHQSGTPILHAKSLYDSAGKKFYLTLKQSWKAIPDGQVKVPLPIPVKLALLGADGSEQVLRMGGRDLGNEAVLVLDSAQQTYVFENVSSRPVPSLLREFSAPVKLESDLSDEDLEFLLANDRDAFVRWDSGYALSFRHLKKMISQHHESGEVALDPKFVQAFERVLQRASEDPALAAQLLHLPEDKVVEEALDFIPRDSLHAAREHMEQQLGSALKNQLLQTYRSLHRGEAYRFGWKEASERELKNSCLNLLVATGDAEMIELAFEQLRSADNMTDERAALQALSHCRHENREKALKIFYDRWKHDGVVMDKWFSAQAGSRHPDVLKDMERLSQDPAFDPENPNKIRSLWGAFMRNSYHFHNLDGSGYRLIADQILEIDRKNPMMAARLASAFSSWNKHDTSRRSLMEQEMKRVLGVPTLSRNTYEMIFKALQS